MILHGLTLSELVSFKRNLELVSNYPKKESLSLMILLPLDIRIKEEKHGAQA
jgi:hypothetical protein